MFLRMMIVMSATIALQANAADGLKPKIAADRVLFLGNSITWHPAAEKIGWTTEWGMAASAKEKDYVHLVASGLADLTGKKPEIQAVNIADFERGLSSYDIEVKLKKSFDFQPTLVVVAIGENVAVLKTDEAKTQFQTSFAKLLTAIHSHGKPTLVVRSCFWADTAKDGIMREACVAAGGIFVDIGELGKDKTNFASSERKFSHDGVGGHPGDKGMKGIADAILKAVKP